MSICFFGGIEANCEVYIKTQNIRRVMILVVETVMVERSYDIRKQIANGEMEEMDKFVTTIQNSLSGGDDGEVELCTPEQFSCASTGRCIPKVRRRLNTGDALLHHFPLTFLNSSSFLQRWVCDYHKDCENGEDEYANCRKYRRNENERLSDFVDFGDPIDRSGFNSAVILAKLKYSFYVQISRCCQCEISGIFESN